MRKEEKKKINRNVLELDVMLRYIKYDIKKRKKAYEEFDFFSLSREWKRKVFL